MNVATADVKSGGLESKDVIMMPGGVYGRDFFNAHGPNAASQLSRSLFRVIDVEHGSKRISVELMKENIQFRITRNDRSSELYAAPDQVFLYVEETLDVCMLFNAETNALYIPKDGQTFQLLLTGLTGCPVTSTSILDRFLAGYSGSVHVQRTTRAVSQYKQIPVYRLVKQVKPGMMREEAMKQYNGRKVTINASFKDSKAEASGVSKEVRDEQIVALYRPLYRFLQKVYPEVDTSPRIDRVINGFRVVSAQFRRVQKGKKVVVLWDGVSDCTKAQLGFEANNMTGDKFKSKSHVVFTAMVNRLSIGAGLLDSDDESESDEETEYRSDIAVMGRGFTHTPAEAEIMRIHTGLDEYMSVVNYITNLGEDGRHLEEWGLNNPIHIMEIKEANQFILQKMADHTRMLLDQAIMRDRLRQPIDPRAQVPRETKWQYALYMEEFKYKSLKPEQRPEIEKELESYPAMLDALKKEIMADIDLTFAKFRLPSGFACYVNISNQTKMSMYDFEEAKVVSYDKTTGMTKIALNSSCWKTVDVFLPDPLVRLDIKSKQEAIPNEEFMAIRTEVKCEKFWRDVVKKNRRKNAAARRVIQEYHAKERENTEEPVQISVKKRGSSGGSVSVAKRSKRSATAPEAEKPSDDTAPEAEKPSDDTAPEAEKPSDDTAPEAEKPSDE
jgi:hypothetical protein